MTADARGHEATRGLFPSKPLHPATPTTYRRCDQPGGATVAGKDGPHPKEGCRFGVGPHEHTQDFKEEPDARAESCQLQSTGVVSTEVVMLERRVGPKLGLCLEGCINGPGAGAAGGVAAEATATEAMAAAAAAAAGGGAAQRRERRRRRRRRWRRRRRQRRERPQRPDWRRRAAVKTADGGGGGGGEDRTTRTPAASRTIFILRISCGLYEPSAMALDVRHMQLPTRPS